MHYHGSNKDYFIRSYMTLTYDKDNYTPFILKNYLAL